MLAPCLGGAGSGGRLLRLLKTGTERWGCLGRGRRSCRAACCRTPAVGARSTMPSHPQSHPAPPASPCSPLPLPRAPPPAAPQRCPRLVSVLRDVWVCTLSCGSYHNLALSSQGQVYSWGSGARPLEQRLREVRNVIEWRTVPALPKSLVTDKGARVLWFVPVWPFGTALSRVLHTETLSRVLHSHTGRRTQSISGTRAI